MPRARRVIYREGQRVVLEPGQRADHVSTTAQRGYGAAFQRAGREAKAHATHCANCGVELTDDNPATSGHSVALRAGGTLVDGVEAQCGRCNYGYRASGL